MGSILVLVKSQDFTCNPHPDDSKLLPTAQTSHNSRYMYPVNYFSSTQILALHRHENKLNFYSMSSFSKFLDPGLSQPMVPTYAEALGKINMPSYVPPYSCLFIANPRTVILTPKTACPSSICRRQHSRQVTSLDLCSNIWNVS